MNAVLRNILRNEEILPISESVNDLSVIYSCPIEIIESLISDYGLENTIELLKESLKPAPLAIKINTLKTDIATFASNIGVELIETPLKDAFILKRGIDITNNNLYKNGKFYVQDLASQMVVTVLNPKPKERMLDMCSAPGGKSFTSAIAMQNNGEIISCDLYKHKCNLIENSAKRLNLNIISTKICDATVFDASLGNFDCILCDVPCSGLGIIRRKPEIKYKNFAEFDNLPEIQLKILNNAKKYLKPSGRILYSTCTLRKAENEEIINKFLNQNSDITLDYSHTFMPHKDGTDGFFCALLIKQ